ncbi:MULTISPECIES: hypothetical protein [Streptomyces]|uniref:Integral membrane protein n=1 Tax=Streptomyces clavifer TaxID=68188 RepID=A0ABS4V369_9ACTN|nr:MULTISPECIES: hypothetical protein [Streptomyces]MBP2358321.1 hypothetical protein [Streptomyces clavifer]MDX2742021.1 hypothetical protein [Streptomyces sp. NRRL_B-2557]GHA90113.1 hypothetical protein GCM10010392_15900 [Streptomyces clavifer]
MYGPLPAGRAHPPPGAGPEGRHSVVRESGVPLITASDPWQGHDVGVLLVVLLTGAPALLGLTAYLCSRLSPRARRRYTPPARWRDLSLAAAAAALALYLWGCLHVLFLEDQEQAMECERNRPGGTPRLVGRRGDFVPLRLVCETSDGSDFSVVIPGCINPALAVLLLLTLGCGLVSVLLHRKRRTAAGEPG